LAHAVLVSESFLEGEPFVMYLGDNLLKQGAKSMAETFLKNKSDCVIGAAEVKDPSKYGVVVLGQDGKIKQFVEKPKQPVSNWGLVGVYVFNSRIIDAAKRIKPSWRGELEITDAIQTLLGDGAKIDLEFVNDWWKDTGKPSDILEANQLILQEIRQSNRGTIEEGATVSGTVNIGKGTMVHGNSTLRGPLIIGDECQIGPGTYVGPYTSVGNQVTIKNTEVENSILMDGVYADCGKRIVDSLIGAGSRIVSTSDSMPHGLKFILGDMSQISV
jgi:glucose-1-phosphate thymidylyltransferase